MHIDNKKAMYLLNLLNNISEHNNCSPHHHEAVCLAAILSRFNSFRIQALIDDIEKELLHDRPYDRPV